MNVRTIICSLLFVIGSVFTAPAYAQDLDQFNEVPGHLMLDFGFNFLQGNPSQQNVNPFRSGAWSVSYLYPFYFGEGSSWSVNVGAGLMQNYYGFENNVLPLYDTASINPTNLLYFDTVNQVLPASSVTVSQMAATYVYVPVEFRWELSPDYRRTNLFVAAGGSVGYRLGSFSKVRYTQGTGLEAEDKVLKRKESFQLNDLRYGAHVRVGINFFNIYGRYEFSPLWRPADNNPAGSSWQVGVSIDLF